MGRERHARQRAEDRRAQLHPVAGQRPAAHESVVASSTAANVLALQRSAGNHAVGRILGRPSGPVLQRWPYIVQAGYMSGDMFGISAALVLNPKAGVVIL